MLTIAKKAGKPKGNNCKRQQTAIWSYQNMQMAYQVNIWAPNYQLQLPFVGQR